MPDKLDDLIESARAVDRLEPAHADALFERLTVGLGAPSGTTTTGTSATGTSGAADPSVIVGVGGPGVHGASLLGLSKGTWLVGAMVAGAIGWATIGAPRSPDPSESTSGGQQLAKGTPMESLVTSDRTDEATPPETHAKIEEARAVSPQNESAKYAEPSALRTSTGKRPAPPKDALAEEVALVRAAKLELNAKRYQHALARLDEYDRKFPTGELRSESQATRILALCGLRRPDAAKQAASQLDENSVLGKRLGAGCPTP